MIILINLVEFDLFGHFGLGVLLLGVICQIGQNGHFLARPKIGHFDRFWRGLEIGILVDFEQNRAKADFGADGRYFCESF